MTDLRRLLHDLSDPSAYPAEAWGAGPRGIVEVVQTHISVVFLTATRAYKVKKPVSLWGLVDYTTREKRERFCHEEVRLNRRLAPDVYLGVVPIVEREGRLGVGAEGQGPAVEHAVVMRRFAAEHTLESRVQAGTATSRLLEALGRRLATFHREHRLEGQERDALTPLAHARVLLENLRATRADVPRLFPAESHRLLERHAAGGLLRLRRTLTRRLADGLGVDGHGDIRLDHVLVEPDGRGGERMSVVDTTEFTTRLRHLDPLSDLAFLVMDLLAHGRLDLVQGLFQGYGVGPAEAAPLAHFAAYRAHVRAKVEATVAAAEEMPPERREQAAARARGYLALALTLAARPSPPSGLIVLRGPSGSGKSVLARAIAPWLGAEIVQSDVVRKSLFGLTPRERPTGARRDEVYGPAAGERTYAEVLRRALEARAGGRHAILDATYLLAGARRAVREAAARCGAPCVIVDLVVPDGVARGRIAARARRGDDPSDADVSIYESQLRTAEPLEPDERRITLTFRPGDEPEALALEVATALSRGAGGAADAPANLEREGSGPAR